MTRTAELYCLFYKSSKQVGGQVPNWNANRHPDQGRSPDIVMCMVRGRMHVVVRLASDTCLLFDNQIFSPWSMLPEKNNQVSSQLPI